MPSRVRRCSRISGSGSEQAAAKTSVLLLKSATGSIAEICARTLQAPKMARLGLSASSAPLTHEMLANAAGGILFVSDLMLLGKLQQKNLVYALERLEKHNLQLVAASAFDLDARRSRLEPALLARLGEVWVALPQLSSHPDDVPEIAGILLSHLVERNEVPARRFSSAALNALRLHHWQGEWAELLAAVRNLALAALEDEITVDDVNSVLERDVTPTPKAPPALPLFNQPLRGRAGVRASILRASPEGRKRQHDADCRQDRAGTHAPVPQVEAIGVEHRSAQRRTGSLRGCE